MVQKVYQFWREEEGQDLIEYTLLMAFVMFTIIGLASGFLEPRHVHIGQREMTAAPRQSMGEPAPDAARRAGDDGSAPLQLHVSRHAISVLDFLSCA